MTLAPRRYWDDMFLSTVHPPSFFENFFSPELSNLTAFSGVDYYRENGKYVVSMDLPGMNPEEINIELTGNHLVIHGKREHRRNNDKSDSVHYGSFRKEVSIPRDVNTGENDVTYDRGVLTVTFPLLAELPSGTRKLSVNYNH